MSPLPFQPTQCHKSPTLLPRLLGLPLLTNPRFVGLIPRIRSSPLHLTLSSSLLPLFLGLLLGLLLGLSPVLLKIIACFHTHTPYLWAKFCWPSTNSAPIPPSQPTPSPSQPDLGHGMHSKIPSVLLGDYVTNSVVAPSPSCFTPSLQSALCTPYPKAHYVNCDNFLQIGYILQLLHQGHNLNLSKKP